MYKHTKLIPIPLRPIPFSFSNLSLIHSIIETTCYFNIWNYNPQLAEKTREIYAFTKHYIKLKNNLKNNIKESHQDKLARHNACLFMMRDFETLKNNLVDILTDKVSCSESLTTSYEFIKKYIEDINNDKDSHMYKIRHDLNKLVPESKIKFKIDKSEDYCSFFGCFE
jgi:hypothetical protein